MVSESAARESRLADAEADVEAPDDQPRMKRRRVKVRRKQDKFPHALRIAIMIGAPLVLWTAIYFLGRAVL